MSNNSKTVNLINPAQDSRDTAQILATGSKYTTLAVCLTTGIGVFIWASDICAKYLPPNFPGADIIAPVFGFLFAAGAGWLTDVGFGKILQKVLFNILASKHPNVQKWNNGQGDYFNKMQTGERVGLIVLLLALLTLDAVSTVIIRDPVAERAGNNPLISVDSLRNTLATTQAAELATLRARSKEKSRAIAEARSRVGASNPALLSLKASGNGWAAAEIAKKQAKATKADALALEKNEMEISSAIEQNRQYTAARIQEAEQHNQQNQERNQRNQEVTGTMYIMFSVGLKILTIILRAMLVLTFCAYSYRFNPDLTGDRIINYEDLEVFGSASAQQPANFH